jgi:hypothetical protein
MGQRNMFILKDREGDEGKAGSQKKNKGRKRRSERGSVTTKAY